MPYRVDVDGGRLNSPHVPLMMQAQNSTTFLPPPLDGSMTLPEIYEWHLRHSPDHPVFEYLMEDDIHKTLFWRDVSHAIKRVARIVRRRMQECTGIVQETHAEAKVVAIIANSDTITFFTVIVGVMLAGLTVFPIAPGNSAAAIAHLVSLVRPEHILVGRDHAEHDLVMKSFDILQDRDSHNRLPTFSSMPEFDDLYSDTRCEEIFDIPYIHPDYDSIGIILHSSGSTDFPKPIKWSHRMILQMCLIPWNGERDLAGQRLAIHSIPMYHAMGALQTMWTASSGLVITCFRPQLRDKYFDPNIIFEEAMRAQSNIIFTVPKLIEIWSLNQSYVERLSKISGIICGGGPLNKEKGDYLASQGVTIFMLYGCSEAGIISTILLRDVGPDWEYFRISPFITPIFVDNGIRNMELRMLSTATHQLAVHNMEQGGQKAFATSDLLSPHPTKHGLWKVFGRVIDQISHPNGETTNPRPLENILEQDNRILSTVIFGYGQVRVGVIIDPRPEYKPELFDSDSLTKFKNEIWTTVERMNTTAPEHSKLAKDMILISQPTKPFSYTAKSTVRRQAVINEYAAEIDTLFLTRDILKDAPLISASDAKDISDQQP